MMNGGKPVYVCGFNLSPQATGFSLAVKFVDVVTLEHQKHNFFGGDIDKLIILAESKREEIRLSLIEVLSTEDADAEV